VAPRTSNLYGKIIIKKRAIRHTVVETCKEQYGIAAVGKRIKTKYGERISEHNAVKVSCTGNYIDISVKLYLKFGVTIDPVIENTRRAIKHNVESFTGMTVECVNIDVLGIQN
jgi:uncharacterized alkaline shock family protein YloU